jgi:DNA replication and repair protein RecF
MRLTQLRVTNLRCLVDVELTLAPGLNLFTGGNGAGKTSLIEAVHLLGYGRSFRGRVRDGLIRLGQEQLELFAQWCDGQGRDRRAGLRHRGSDWEARLDGQAIASLGELCAELAVVSFEPGSHELIAGGAEHRRRYLDWGLFHVEPRFLPCWRRYGRALKQRNALLKRRPPPALLDPWDRELAESGEPLHRLRAEYLEQLEPYLAATAAEYLPELGSPRLSLAPGWKRQELSLADALLLARERDLALGHTSFGPHRADWRLEYAGLPSPAALSRGQEKLTALVCILGQACAYAVHSGNWPVICLDDLSSELDAKHQEQVLRSVLTSGAQVLLAGTEAPAALSSIGVEGRKFHVERGTVVAETSPEYRR